MIDMQETPIHFWKGRLDLVVVIAAILGIVFTIGQNWTRIAELERRQSEIDARQSRIEQGMSSLSVVVTDQRVDVRVMLQKQDTLQQDLTELKNNFSRAFK